MVRKKLVHFTVIMAIIGFMLAIQVQTTKQPAVRDTRDIWQLRQDLKKEQQLEQQLLLEIRRNDEKIQKLPAKSRRKPSSYASRNGGGTEERGGIDGDDGARSRFDNRTVLSGRLCGAYYIHDFSRAVKEVDQ